MLCDRCYEKYEVECLEPIYEGPSYVDISFYSDEGSVIAYVVDTSRENLFYWLESNGYAAEYENLRDTYKRVAILRSIWVEEDCRGMGIGNKFMERFILLSTNNGAEAALLVADLGEHNDFDLVQWYKNWEFDIISNAEINPLMLRELK